MSALVRSSFHAFTLAMLACACTLVAQTINTVVGASLLPLPTTTGAQPREASTASSSPTPLSAELLARQTGLSLGTQSKPPPEPTRDMQSTQLALKLLGTMTSPNSAMSLASVYDDALHRTRTVWTGSTLQGAEVVSIERTRLLLANGGRVEILDISSIPAASAMPAAPAPAGASTGLGSSIRQTGPESYAIRRQDLDNTLTRLNDVAMQARIVPAFREGISKGFKLFAMKPDSIYARLGMKNGDILQRINGFTLDDPTRALEAYNNLKGSSRLELELERDGQPLRKTFSVEN